MADKKAKSHRELIDTGRDKRFVRRDEKGEFEDVSDVGRSLDQDRKQAAKHKVPRVKAIAETRKGNRSDELRESFRSGARRFPFPVASLSKVLKIFVEHARMTDQTHLLGVGWSVRPDQRPTPRTDNFKLRLASASQTFGFLFTIVFSQAHLPD